MHLSTLAALLGTTLTVFMPDAYAGPAHVPPFTLSSKLTNRHNTSAEFDPPKWTKEENGAHHGYFPEHSKVDSSGVNHRTTRSNANKGYDDSVRHFACGTDLHGASPHFQRTVERLHAQQLADPNLNPALSGPSSAFNPLHARSKSSSAGKAKNPPAPPTPSTASLITVPLYIHIISTAAHANLTTPNMALAQFAELNAAYAPAGITFTLQNVSTTINDLWATDDSDDTDLAMKTALRQGSYSALNLYFQSDVVGGLLGTCTLPLAVPAGAAPDVYVLDGCKVLAGSMPGGAVYGYNMGKTAVHETGHWFGLLHTFEGYSCDGLGDGIADTPAESVSTDGCPRKPAKNSCPLLPGLDPISNYMDYSDDECYTQFSAGQMVRMGEMWELYRRGR